jgi:glucose/arabinose dehydrogenase
MRYLLSVCVLSLLCVGWARAQDQTLRDGNVSYTVTRYAVGNYPIALVMADDGRLFFTEKITGNVRVVAADGALQREPVITLPTESSVERGLLGIALDPNYNDNGYIWLYGTAPGTARDFPANRIVRFREQDGVGSAPVTLWTLPITNGEVEHNGGNLHFGPDGFLYVTVGDYREPALAQDFDAAQGKIHRFAVVDDALVPAPDNPFGESSVWAMGLRNSWDFAFDTFNTDPLAILATENGQNCDDEINLIFGGFNYGAGAYPDDDCKGVDGVVDVPLYQPPLIAYQPTIAPTGIVLYDHEAAEAWRGEVFFCAWNTGELTRLTLNERRDAVTRSTTLDLGGAQCRIDLAQGTDGALYFSTVGADSGEIYRIQPQQEGT